jgi:SAM-dependent methyltransferase
MFRKVVPGSSSRLTIVDHKESYGRHIIKKCIAGLQFKRCVDLGCGLGQDLSVIKKYNPEAECFGVNFSDWNREDLLQNGIKPVVANIEHDTLPFDNESVDLFILNQILEHTKEIYWINHEVFRCLKKDGHLILGVPNILSLHNRLLGLMGIHPTQAKLLSAHIRCFSKKDTMSFYREVANSFACIEKFYGSQFYPFPQPIARMFANIFPSLAFTIFFFIRKTDVYHDQFLDWPNKARLETNFFTGANV